MSVLFVANYPPDTGYAWETIESVLRGVGDRLVCDGHEIHFAYATYHGIPSRPMRGAPFHFFAFEYERTRSPLGMLRFCRMLRQRQVTTIYLTDRPTLAWQYLFYRLSGVRHILVHDRTSGERKSSKVHRVVKAGMHRVRAVSADCCLAISEFVRDRIVSVNSMPADRVRLVYNGLDVTRFRGADPHGLHKLLQIDVDIPIIFCSGRAQEYKGVHVLIDAAAQLKARGITRVAFVYCGDGPILDELKQRASRKELDNFHFMGARTDVPQLLQSANIAVVPSLWEEAFGLTVVEGMAAGKPVVASRAGGIPELVEDGAGVLFDKGDSKALADAIDLLLRDEDLRGRLGAVGARRAQERFSLERVVRDLYTVISEYTRSPSPIGATNHTEEIAISKA